MRRRPSKKPEEFDPFDPAQHRADRGLAGQPESKDITGRVFNVKGGNISVAEGWVAGPGQDKGDRWDPAELGKVVPGPGGQGRAQRQHGRAAGVGSGPWLSSAPPLAEPGRDVRGQLQVIHDNAERLFLWDYERDRGQLVTLYNKAMGSQWNSVKDLDWSIDVDPERLVAEQDSPIARRRPGGRARCRARRWRSGRRRSTRQLGIEFFKANLSQFMHGEQGAMMTAAKIVETVPWIDAKYYASTQTMDEARHTEVFAKYLRTKLGDAYPMSPFLKAQIWGLLEDSRWDIAYLGMQIVIESLALAAFGDMLRRTKEPLLTKLLRYVMSDEARHVAFGVLTLSEYYADMSEAELRSARSSCSTPR